MRKFLNRPAFGLVALFVIVFFLLAFKSYIEMVDHLMSPVSVEKVEIPSEIQIDQNKNSLQKSERSGDTQRSKLSKKSGHTEKVINTKITLGTFDALNGTSFLQKAKDYESLFKNPDNFTDLVKALQSMQHEYTNANPEKIETLGNVMDLSLGGSDVNSMMRFHSEISRYRMYSDSQTVDDLLYDMATQPIRKIEEKDGGTQFKLTVTFSNQVVALFKPRRVAREQEALPNQFHFSEYERHTSEIAAFHLDRVLGFRRALPVVGRNVNMIVELLRIAPPDLQRTFFISPKPDENICFIGTGCTQFCDEYHPICGNGTMIEGSFMVYFPQDEAADRISRSHPWSQSYSDKPAPWENNPNYCNEVKITEPNFSSGNLLSELIDMSIFDFLIGNMDRHNYQRFEAFLNDTFTPRYDHGRAFGKAFHDELKILAPLLQCCMISSSTLENLLNIHTSHEPLSKRMEKSMSVDPIAPILWQPHLEALDRRLITVMQVIRDCIDNNGADSVIFTKETADITKSVSNH